MTTIAKDFARGCGSALVIRVIAIVIGLPLGCIWVFMPIWLLSHTDFQPWAIVVAAVVWLLPLFIGGVGFPAGVIFWRKAKLDAVFVPLGLTGRAYQTRFRQYHGEIQGRHVDVYFYRGPVLEIEVSTTLHTRLGVTSQQSDARFFADLMGHQPLEFNDPALSDLTVLGTDEAWVKSLFIMPDVADLLHRLIAPRSSIFTRQQMILRPGTLELMLSGNRRLFGMDLMPQQVRIWLDDLLQLVRIAENLPMPQITTELSLAEQSVQKLRRRNPYIELWVGVGLVVFFLVIGFVVFAAVFLFASMTGGL